ncbi:hypothetical protein [Pseudoalteromonas translucida]|uniref:Orphan protein n=1 Tax=Pseudoalteromonas translucida (strain TAC 125) TaxID=326442 RepID=Q3ILR5_PSET1|nr:hypothetical protein [Pseudoalteromonas translucida]CAI85307.1 putative orphan protein [Pseudoalteromonas translucida]
MSIVPYINVLDTLSIVDDLSKVALDYELGRKLQDIELLNKKR